MRSPERIRTAATALRGRHIGALASAEDRWSPYFIGILSVGRVGSRGPPMDVLLPRCCPAKINKSGEFEVCPMQLAASSASCR